MQPAVQTKIKKVETVVNESRKSITKEALENNVKLTETVWYKIYFESMKQKEKLNTLSNAIGSFKMNWVAALKNPTVVSLVNSIKNTPEWQNILLQASFMHTQEIKWKYKTK